MKPPPTLETVIQKMADDLAKLHPDIEPDRILVFVINAVATWRASEAGASGGEPISYIAGYIAAMIQVETMFGKELSKACAKMFQEDRHDN